MKNNKYTYLTATLMLLESMINDEGGLLKKEEYYKLIFDFKVIERLNVAVAVSASTATVVVVVI